MKTTYIKLPLFVLSLVLMALVSCAEDESTATKEETAQHQRELEQWQVRAESEFEKRRVAESKILSSSNRAATLEKCVISVGICALLFLFIGAACGSKTKKDALES